MGTSDSPTHRSAGTATGDARQKETTMAERYMVTDEVVDDGDECPCCHEARIDRLEWTEDYETVKCLTCWYEYVPGSEGA